MMIAKRISGSVAVLLFAALHAGPARADTTVQIPLPGVLDTRSVFTLTNGVIVPFTLAIDGGNGDVGTGAQNGFATKAVAMMKSPSNVANSLPDDGFFPADMNHPDLSLNFSNTADATSPQNHLVKPMNQTTKAPPETFSFPVPPATYSKLFLFFHGANSGTTVKITLTYADATTDVTNATIPDFFAAPTDPKVFALASDLAKWTKTTTIAEGGGHRIFGVTMMPMAKTLSTVKVERGNTGYLVFWGATGVATTAVGTLPDAGTTGAAGASADGGAGAAGTGGAAGAAGAGTAGASGAAGSTTGAAGSAGTAGAGGAGTSGAAGSTTGASGTGGTGTGGGAGATTTGAGGATVKHSSSSSGCQLAAAETVPGGTAAWLLVAAIASRLRRARRRR